VYLVDEPESGLAGPCASRVQERGSVINRMAGAFSFKECI
jgi:hypothetical protein